VVKVPNGITDRLASLAGTVQFAKQAVAQVVDVDRYRAMMGGQLAPIPVTQCRWYPADVETARRMADTGDLSYLAQLWDSCVQDGKLAGVLSTRTGGLVRLPKKFKGNADQVAQLKLGEGDESARSVFDEMCPPAELAALAADGIGLGVGVGELLPVNGRKYPVLVRHDPQFLRYRWAENRWYLRTVGGETEVTPGLGKWVLHTPGGRLSPWKRGLCPAIGRSFIYKDHALAADQNWQRKLANPARVAQAPGGAAEEEAQSFWRQVMAWGYDSVFGLRPGYEIKLLESNGRGSDSFDRTIKRSDEEMIVAIAGQLVTTTGGTGFANADIHQAIRADLIKQTADDLAYTLNTQVLPPWVVANWGPDALADMAVLAWDVDPPKNLQAKAQAFVSLASASKGLDEVLASRGERVNLTALATDFVVPTEKLPEPVAVAPLVVAGEQNAANTIQV
jgi:phage gp29-like protein